MVGIYGIGSVPEAANNVGQSVSKEKRVSPETSSSHKDEVKISPEARGAAQAAKLIAVSEAQKELQAVRVAEAKENLEKGTHRVQEVLRLVAGRVNTRLEVTM